MDALEQIAAAVLYEGYVLWPYRRSARKNQQRWTFGGVYPSAFARGADRSRVQTECLVRGAAPVVEAELRFLHVVARRLARRTASGDLLPADELVTGGQRILAWDEARERRIGVAGSVSIPGGEEREVVEGGEVTRSWVALTGDFDVSVVRVSEDVHRVRAVLTNTSQWNGSDRDGAQRHGFMSAHIVLRARDGSFVSATDPPLDVADAAEACRNDGLWPVLVHDEHTVLASPIILSDYPQVAPESPGLWFDSGEIDQLLVLNTLALSDAEKAEVRATDPRARELIDRAESLTMDDMASLHGAIREFRMLSSFDAPAPERVVVDGVELRAGSEVRLRPRRRADAFDIILDGKTATVESIQQDVDDHIQLAVTIADDPGRDLGMQRMPGHRFFFAVDEVEPLA